MAAQVNLTLTFHHHDWIRLRAHALISRQTLEDLIYDALQAALYRMGVADPPPQPQTFSDRLNAIVAQLAQAEALIATMTAAAHKGTHPPSPDDVDITTRGAALRASHTHLDLNREMKLRPKIDAEIWRNFKGHSYLQGKEPTEAAQQAIIQHLGPALTGVSDPAQIAPLTKLLDEAIETLTTLRQETADPGFTF